MFVMFLSSIPNMGMCSSQAAEPAGFRLRLPRLSCGWPLPDRNHTGLFHGVLLVGGETLQIVMRPLSSMLLQVLILFLFWR